MHTGKPRVNERLRELADARERIAHHAEDLESLVAERTAELEESVRSLEGVLYHLAHDLRAPLRAMEGFTQLLLEHEYSCFDATGRDYAWRIVSAASLMDHWINDVLAYGRLIQMEVPCAKLDLEAQLGRVLAQMSGEIRIRKARIRVVKPMPRVWANAAVLDQILGNLLANALKFVGPGIPPQVRICARESGDGKLRLCVRDKGIGIEEAHQQRIFGMFERLHGTAAYPGTGIGLAIVRKGAERMGGTVGVKSRPGHGSLFWVELPAAPMTV